MIAPDSSKITEFVTFRIPDGTYISINRRDDGGHDPAMGVRWVSDLRIAHLWMFKSHAYSWILDHLPDFQLLDPTIVDVQVTETITHEFKLKGLQ